MDIENLTDSLSSSLKKAQGPQIQDIDAANRVFRTMVNDGMSRAFETNKQILAQIFDTIDMLQTQMLESENQTNFVSLAEIYERLEENHINLGGRGRFPDREQFAYYLAILASEEPPFLHTLREFVMGDEGLRVKTSYVGPSNRFPDIAVRAYSAANKRTALLLNQARKGTELFLDWEQVQKTIETRGLEAAGLKRERIDHVLKGLFLRPTKDKDYNNLAARINGEIQQWIYLPLMQQLRGEKIVIVLTVDDLRNSSNAELKKLSPLMFLNNPARIEQRYLHLCGILMDSPISKQLDPALMAAAEKNRDAPETFLQSAGPMAMDLLEKLKKGLGLAQPFLDVAVEAGKLAEWFRMQAKQKEQQTELNELQAAAEKIKKYGNLLDVRNEKRLGIKERHIRFFLEDRVPGILATTVPYMTYDPNFDLKEFDAIYLIFKDRNVIARAVDNALEVYNKVGDDYLLHMLEKLLRLEKTSEQQLKQYVPPVHLVRLKDALKHAYVRYLPFFTRMFMRLLSSEPTPDQIRQAKQNRMQNDAEVIRRIKERTLSSEKRQATREVKARARRSLAEHAADVSPVQRAEILAKLKPFLDDRWARGDFPTHDQIVRQNDLGSPIVLENFLKTADKGDPAFEIVSITAEGRQVYATRAYLEKNRDAVIEHCEKVVQQQLEASGSPDVDERSRAAAGRIRRFHTAILQHVQKLF